MLIGTFATLAYCLRGFNGYLSTDLGTYTYAGQMVADGQGP